MCYYTETHSTLQGVGKNFGKNAKLIMKTFLGILHRNLFLETNAWECQAFPGILHRNEYIRPEEWHSRCRFQKPMNAIPARNANNHS